MFDPEDERNALDRNQHWTPVQLSPQVLAFRRKWRDELNKAEIFDERLDSFEYMESVSEESTRRRAGLSKAEWLYVEKTFRDVLKDYSPEAHLYQKRLGFILKSLRVRILEGYRSPAVIQKEKAERSRLKAKTAAKLLTVRKDGTAYEKSPEERARISENMKKVWAKRRREKHE